MTEREVQLLIRLPESERRALKILAAERGTSSTAIMRRLIRDLLADQRTRQGA